MRDDCGIARFSGHLHSIQCFCEGTDLIELDEDRIGHAHPDSAGQSFGIGHKQIVSDQLNTISQSFGELFPAIPIFFRQFFVVINHFI